MFKQTHDNKFSEVIYPPSQREHFTVVPPERLVFKTER